MVARDRSADAVRGVLSSNSRHDRRVYGSAPLFPPWRLSSAVAIGSALAAVVLQLAGWALAVPVAAANAVLWLTLGLLGRREARRRL
jgi:hypothetical protein